MKNSGIKKNYIYNLTYQILVMIIPFITAPYVSRVLGASNIGIHSFTVSIQTYVSLLAALGTSAYGQRMIARSRENKEEYSRLFWEIEILSVITSMICVIAWLIFCALSKEYTLYYRILTFNILAVTFDISWFYSGLEQYKHIVTRNAFFKVLGTVLILSIVRTKADLWLYFLILSMATFLGNVSMWVSLPRFLAKVKVIPINLKEHFRQTLVYFLPTIATSVYTVLDKAMLGMITDNMYENGYYEQASKIIYMGKSVILSMNSIMYSRMSFLFYKQANSELHSKMQKNIDFVMILGMPITVGMMCVANNFVPIFFGEGYEKVSILIILYSSIIVITGLTNSIGGSYYNASGRRSESTKYIICGSIINLGLNALLIPHYGAVGAVIASIIAECSILLLYIKHTNGFVTRKIIFNNFYKRIAANSMMAICVISIKKLHLDGILMLILQVCGGAAVYFFMLVILKESLIRDVCASLKKVICKR